MIWVFNLGVKAELPCRHLMSTFPLQLFISCTPDNGLGEDVCGVVPLGSLNLDPVPGQILILTVSISRPSVQNPYLFADLAFKIRACLLIFIHFHTHLLESYVVVSLAQSSAQDLLKVA